MNRVKHVLPGGFRVTMDDFEFSQVATRNAFLGWLTGFGIGIADGMVISGAAVTVNGANLDITDGFIVIDGEILQVDAHTIVDPGLGGDQMFWTVDVSFDISGQKIFKDNSVNDVYEVRKGVLTSSAAPPAQFFAFDRTLLSSPTLDDKIREKILDRQNIFLKPQTYQFGSQTNTNGDQINLAADGSNYEVVMNTLDVKFMKLIGEGAIIGLHMAVGTNVAVQFISLAGAPPAGFGDFLVGLPSFVAAVNQTVYCQQIGDRWHIIGGSAVLAAIAQKKNSSEFQKVVQKPANAAIAAAVEKVIETVQFFGASSNNPTFHLNINLKGGTSLTVFNLRIYKNAALQSQKQIHVPIGELYLAHMMDSFAITVSDTIQWRVETAQSGSSWETAISILEATDVQL